MLSFFFNDTATTEIYTLSLHDALPISRSPCRPFRATPFATRRIWKQKTKLIVRVSATTSARRLRIRKRVERFCAGSQCSTRSNGPVRCMLLSSARGDHQFSLRRYRRQPADRPDKNRLSGSASKLGGANVMGSQDVTQGVQN